MDLDELMLKYPNISKAEFEHFREISHYQVFNVLGSSAMLSALDKRRERGRVYGTESICAGPLVQLLSAQILPNDQNVPLTIFGRIFARVRDASNGNSTVHDFYSRKRDNPQVVLGQNDTLELISPAFSNPSYRNCMPLQYTKLVVDVYMGGNKLSAEFAAGGDTTDFEQVKLVHIRGDHGSLALRYIAMPFAVYGLVAIHFYRREGYKSDRVDDSLKVKGKIVARCGNTFGGYASEEYTLFDKQSNEFERVVFGLKSMRLSRGWVGLPAYSNLIIDLDLWELETERKILKETVELRVGKERDEFPVDGMLVVVKVTWYPPRPQGRKNDESSDDETSEEESDVEQKNEICAPEASSKRKRPWKLIVHKDIPLSSSSVQIFSIYIGREKLKALQIYGSIEVTSPACTFYLFNRDANDAFRLPEHSKTLPILRRCGPHDHCETMEIKFNLKDLDGHVNIRGYEEWHWSCFLPGTCPPSLDKQLCSVVQGQEGFAAIHYSLFPEAVQANIEVLCVSKNEDAGFSSDVYGSLVARYNNYDYASRYNQDYYGIVLFQRNQEDPVRVGAGGVIVFSRSVVVVPDNSSLIVEWNLSDGFSSQCFSCSTEFQIGLPKSMIMVEENNYSVRVSVKWEEVSN